jgi:type IV secretory pathway VirJ component
MCKGLAPGVASIVEVPGGHGFEGDAPKLAERFLKRSGLNPDRTDRPANAQQGGKKAGGGKP